MWNFHSYHTQSEVDSILDRETFTLNDLFEKGDLLLEECKKRNQKLISFITREDILRQLLGHAVLGDAPAADADPKYPKLSCDILCLSALSSEVSDAYSEHKHLVELIWSTLKDDSPPQLVSNWTRISYELLLSKSSEVLNPRLFPSSSDFFSIIFM
jgi:hypothetical protein